MSKDGIKKVKLPKRIAGVKVPKEIRRTAERAIEQAQSPHGREMIAAGLSMAAAAASAAVVKARADRERATEPPAQPSAPVPPVPPVPPMEPEPHATPRPAQTGATAKPSPDQVADAIGQVAEQVLGRLFGGKR